MEEVEVGLGKDNIQVILAEMTGVVVVVGQDQGQESVLTEIELNVFKCWEYNHFAKDCLNSQTEKELEEIQQMYNLDEEQTTLKVLATDMYENLIRTNSGDTIVDHLNW